MNKTKILILLIFIAAACRDVANKGAPETDLSYIDTRYHGPNDVKTIIDPLMKTENITKDGVHKLTYYLYYENKISDSIKYSLKEDTSYRAKIEVSKNTSYRITYQRDRTYLLNGNRYKIYKYLVSQGGYDGESSHFWNPNLGIILIRSNTWNNQYSITSKTDSVNALLQTLNLLILQDDKFLKEN
ncbi:MAG: hypothetical protein J7604_22150 [Sporocytophaga sp.]|uniref:hypothetical protein n=1 Tax=Sporocytophaga sp. TaxID=2231183 RepID=UPI001B222D05|nr:hypothetical protein [Sporocytophaga sp.]MBO9702933.1 hypothetical protein [Sporocytophaga sp.]